MTLVYRDLGITDERYIEMCVIARNLVKLNGSIADNLRAISKYPGFNYGEKAFMIFAYGAVIGESL